MLDGTAVLVQNSRLQAFWNCDGWVLVSVEAGKVPQFHLYQTPDEKIKIWRADTREGLREVAALIHDIVARDIEK